MSDHGFDIQDELTPLGIRINIPSFLYKDKKQFEENEMVETQRIAFLRIHVEQEMKHIEEFRIFDTPIPASLMHVIRYLLFVLL